MLGRYAASTLLALLVACSGTGGSCSDCSGTSLVQYPEPAPPGGELLTDAVRVHITDNALEFVRTHVGSLLGDSLTVEDGYGVYLLDEALFDAAADPVFLRDGCIGEPDSPCTGATTGVSKISFDLAALSDALTVEWLEPDADSRPGIHVALNDFGVLLDIVMVTNLDLLGAAACRLQNPPGEAAFRLAELSFDVRLDLETSGAGPPVLTSAVENMVVDVDAADDEAINLQVTACDGAADPSCSDPCCAANGTCDAAVAETVCTDAQGHGVCDMFDLFAQLGGFLATVLDPLLAQLGPSIAGAVSDAAADAFAGVPLGVETSIDLASLSGGTLAGSQPVNTKVEVQPGLELAGSGPGRGLQVKVGAGAAAPTAAICASDATPPDLSALAGPPPDFTGFIEVFDDTSGSSHFEPYHAVASVSEATLAQLFWAAFRSGALCLRLDSYDIEALAGGAFPFTAGLLMSFDIRLAGITDPAAPLLLTLWATKEPALRLGAGGPIADGMEDPLIELTIDDLLVGISLALDDNPMRLTAINADLVVRLVVERTPDNTLELVLQDIAVEDVRQLQNELVPASDLSGLFALVVDLAVGQLGDNLRFDLDTAASGVDSGPLAVHLNALRRDVGTTGANFLSLYATLCDVADTADETNAACHAPGAGEGRAPANIAARLADEASLYVDADPARFPADRWDAAPSGRATLRVAAGPGPAVAYAYQFRVDDGPWSSYRAAPDGLLEVESARLLLVGRHAISVRARPVGDYRMRSDAAAVELWVDRERPAIRAWRAGDTVFVETEDLGSGDAVEISARRDGGSWMAVNAEISVAGLSGTLELVARDLAGNRSRPLTIDLGSSTAISADLERAGSAGGGCAAAPVPALLLAPVLLLRRRRRTRPR